MNYQVHGIHVFNLSSHLFISIYLTKCVYKNETPSKKFKRFQFLVRNIYSFVL